MGRFRPGERLPERELCEMTGVSRTLVREALRQLESEGLIHVIPHRGPVVDRLSPEQARGIYQVREELEALTTTLRMLNSRVMLLRSTSMQAPGRAKKSVAELSDLLDALIARNAKTARKAGSLHVRNAAQVAIAILRESIEATEKV